MNRRMMAVAAGLAFTTACSSVMSTRPDDVGEAAGLAYYMPKKELTVSVLETVAKTDGTTPIVEATFTVSESPAFADLSQRYLLRMPHNHFALNKVDVRVSAAGLLSTSSSVESDGQVNEIAASFAQSLAALGDGLDDVGTSAITDANASCPLGVTSYVALTPGLVEEQTLCGKYNVKLVRLVSDDVARPLDGPEETFPCAGQHDGHDEMHECPPPSEPAASGNGFFYRQNEPYGLTVERDGLVLHRSVRFLPNLSPVRFLPLHKTLIGKNQATITFTDGVITQYKQDTEGEAIGAARVPFEVVSAFFGAVGSVFTARTTAVTSEDGYLAAVAALAKRQQQTELCLAAVRRAVQADIEAACP